MKLPALAQTILAALALAPIAMPAADETVTGNLTVKQFLSVHGNLEIGSTMVGTDMHPAYSLLAYPETTFDNIFIDQYARGNMATWWWRLRETNSDRNIMSLESNGKLSIYTSSNSESPAIIFNASGALPEITVAGSKVITEGSIGKILANSGGSDGKIAIGDWAYTIGNYAIAIGTGAAANGGDSFALGTNSSTNNHAATAVGYAASGQGDASVALGSWALASNDRSSALGFEAHATGASSTGLGTGSYAQGNYSTALGYKSVASAPNSLATGYMAHAEGNSALAAGFGAWAQANYSMAAGYYTQTTQPYQVALGSWNQPVDAAYLMLGNGTNEGSRSNALTVSRTGDLWTAGKIWAQKTSAKEPAIQIRGGFPGGPRLQVYGFDADTAAWMGLGEGMGGYSYEHSIYFPRGADHYLGRLTIGDYNGTTYNTRVTVLQNGNVGIGTITPSEKLDVAGNATISGDTTIKGTLRIKPAGDLPMGIFTAGTQP